MQETKNYADSRVLILGGGDGALLKELLNLPDGQAPAHVTMVELDEAVMRGCTLHMLSVCGGYMYPGKKMEEYTVICGDAIKFMEAAKEKGDQP